MYMETKDKPRLFVDMDGTLAEWRPISLLIENDEDRWDILNKLNELLLTPGYYKTLEPNRNIVDAIKILCKKYDIYILSCVIEKEEIPNPISEKSEWLDKYLPEINKDHRIFVPDGHNKAHYIPEGIRKTDYLLDDYTKNLLEFKEAGGIGIKFNNNVNGRYGKWNLSSVSINKSPEDISGDINKIISEGKIIKHTPPDKISDNLYIDRDTDIKDLANNLGL